MTVQTVADAPAELDGDDFDDVDRPAPRPFRRGWWTGERLVLAGLTALTVVLVFGNGWGEFTPDTTPILYLNPRAALDMSLSSWRPSPYQAGFANFNTGLAPVAAVIWVIEAIGIPPWATIRLWRGALLLIGAWGAMRLYRRFDGAGQNATGRVVTAIAFVANPFVMIGGGSTPLLQPYALVPWLLLAFAHAMDEPRRWRWPAGFALIFFAMGGLQAGIAPLLLVLSAPVYVVYSVVFERTRIRDGFLVLLKCTVPAIAVSLYWIIPSALASATGAAVVAESEDPKLVALTSSFGEGIRMLGLWPMYGRLGGRVFVPKGVAYIVNPFVVFSSYLLPIAAALGSWLSTNRKRAFGVLLLLCALPVFVGQYPGTKSSPLGVIIDKVLTTVPGAIAFRTTVKMAPLIVLSFVLLIGLGAGALGRRGLSDRKLWNVVGAGVCVALLAGGIHPAVTGQLYNDGWSIPDYWHAAVADLDSRPYDTRVMIAPGSPGGNYRWGPRSADDIFSSVFERPTVARLTATSGSVFPANFLASMDVALNEDQVRAASITGTDPEATSTMARYFGIGQIAERNDMRWEEFQGARPSVYDNNLATDPGLRQGADFGAPGLNTTNPDAATNEADAALPPIRIYDVRDALPITRAEPAAGGLVIDGDNFAIPGLLQLGYLGGGPSYRLAASMTVDDLRTAIGDRTHLFLTDTNRRRIWGVHRTDTGYTATLAATDSLSRPSTSSMTIFPNRPETQSVTEVTGASRIDGTSRGRSGVAPFGGASAAFDDDPDTAWIAGELGNGLNQLLTVTFERPEEVGKVVIRPLRQRPLQVGAVRVSTDREATAQVVPEDPEAGVADEVVYTFDGSATSKVTAEIVTLSGQGANPVGLAEVEIYDRDGNRKRIDTVLQMPSQLANLTKSLSADEQAALAKLPLDVVMTRAVGTSASGLDDEEGRLLRDFDLAQDRNFWVRGRLTPNRVPSEAALAAYNADPACTRIGTIDGEPLLVSIKADAEAVAAGKAVELAACGFSTLSLRAGPHRIESDPGWDIDMLDLASVETLTGEAAAAPRVTVTKDGSTSKEIQIEAGTAPYYLVTGIGFDTRWAGTIDGKPLPAPALVDGFSLGWRIDDPAAHTVKLSFKPQATMNIAIVVSGISLFVLAVIPLVAWYRRRRWHG